MDRMLLPDRRHHLPDPILLVHEHIMPRAVFHGFTQLVHVPFHFTNEHGALGADQEYGIDADDEERGDPHRQNEFMT